MELLLPPTLKAWVLRYAAVTLMVALWYASLGFSPWMGWWVVAVPTDLALFGDVWRGLPGLFVGLYPSHKVVYIVLRMVQAGLLLGGARLVTLRLIPRAASWPMVGQRGEYLDIRGLKRSWWIGPAFMAFLTLYTVDVAIALVGLKYGLRGAQALQEVGGWPLWISLGLALLGLLWGWRFNEGAKSTISRIMGVKMLEADHPLAQRVHSLSDRLGLPRPAVGIMPQANAFAVGASAGDAAVILGAPLVRAMSEDELDAVIGHELGHIASSDMKQMLMAVGYQELFGKLASLFVIAATLAGLATVKKGDKVGAKSLLFGGAVAERIVGGAVFLAGELMSKALSRKREFFADAVGAALTSPEAMAAALSRLDGILTPPTAEESRFAYLMFKGPRRWEPFATHPSKAQRQNALRKRTYIDALPRA